MHNSTNLDRFPAAWRITLAFVLAPLSGAMVASCLNLIVLGDVSLRVFYDGIWLYSIGAYPSAALIGVPAYFLLRCWVKPTLLNCAAVGALVAVSPWLFFDLLHTPDNNFQAGFEGRDTVVNGHRTAFGWEMWFRGLLRTAVAGFAGGAAFWAVALDRTDATKSA
ncbi:MAG: hypothetical protein KME20_28760 [Kaiparowitsia implicata GSE-PSE-MK54-09C]|jgi:hypothetical protein|nr:hypothetical protein [Kaiparowitsia implicata GSE-PSE-MK54-09C]